MNRNSQNMSSKSHWSSTFPHNNCSVKVQSNTTTCLLYELSSQPRRADEQVPNRYPYAVSTSSEKRIFLLEMWLSFSAVDASHSFADQCCQQMSPLSAAELESTGESKVEGSPGKEGTSSAAPYCRAE